MQQKNQQSKLVTGENLFTVKETPCKTFTCTIKSLCKFTDKMFVHELDKKLRQRWRPCIQIEIDKPSKKSNSTIEIQHVHVSPNNSWKPISVMLHVCLDK